MGCNYSKYRDDIRNITFLKPREVTADSNSNNEPESDFPTKNSNSNQIVIAVNYIANVYLKSHKLLSALLQHCNF